MDLSHPLRSLLPGPRGEILERLASTFEPLTGNQIAELSAGRVSQSSASRLLGGLVQTGLVSARPAGRAILYELNREHMLAGAVVDAVNATGRLVDWIGEAVASWTISAEAVWLFGSTARGDAGPESDVDIVVVRPSHLDAESGEWGTQLSALAEAVHKRSGNGREILEYAWSELADLLDAGDPVSGSLRRDALVVVGQRPPAPRSMAT